MASSSFSLPKGKRAEETEGDAHALAEQDEGQQAERHGAAGGGGDGRPGHPQGRRSEVSENQRIIARHVQKVHEQGDEHGI